MTWMTVWLHRWCVILLAHYHTAGMQLVRVASCKSDAEHFYAGNFWWARASYLLSLNDSRIFTPQDRWSAESWIGTPILRSSVLEPALGRYACLLQPYILWPQPWRYLNPTVHGRMASVVWMHFPEKTPQALPSKCVVNCLKSACGPSPVFPHPPLWRPGDGLIPV